MYKPESAPEYETQKILKEYEIEMNHSNQARRSDQVLMNKKKKDYQQVDFAIQGDHKCKKKKKMNKYLDLA